MALSKIKSLLKQFPFIYPSKIIQSCKDWIDEENKKKGVYSGGRNHQYQLVEPAENYTHKLPALQQTADNKNFIPNIFYKTAPCYLFYFRDCYLYKQTGMILTSRNALFQEFTHHFNIQLLKKFLLKHPFFSFSTNIKHISGIGAVLTSPQSHNYYHWLSDVLPRIKLYNSVLEHIDHFCISASVPQKFRDVLPAFGVPMHKVLLVNDNEKLHFDNLYVASLPGSEGRAPKWAINYIRQKLVKKPDQAAVNKLIYFKRGDINTGRNIMNEDEIINTLKIKGFEIIEPDELSIPQQVALMQQASIIVSAHGAALTNLLFAKEGTTVVEIFSPDYFRTDCYFTLARLLNLNYYYLQGTKPADTDWGSIIVDKQALLNSLSKIN